MDSGNKKQAALSDCFRLASFKDKLIYVSGLILIAVSGASFAMFGLLSGLAFSSFDVRYTEQERNDIAFRVAVYYIITGSVIFLTTTISGALVGLNAQRQGYNFRKAYLKAIFNQEISYFDKINPTELSSQIENDCKAINEALDSQIDMIAWYIGGIICYLVISFARSWQISLIMFVAAPFLLLALLFYGKTTIKAATERAKSYTEAGGISEEALTNIKTVVSLGGEKDEVKRYEGALSKTLKALIKAGVSQGVALGTSQLIFNGIMAVVLFIGAYFIQNETINPTTGSPYNIADIYTPLHSLIFGFSHLPAIVPCLKGVTNAKLKARKILDFIDKSQNSSLLTVKVDTFRGDIVFKDVSFAYPSNPEKLVLQNLSLEIKPNTKIAIVGKSGGGKSTIIQLLQKFYEPQSGRIEFDGHDLKTLDADWVRHNVAYVSQEPVLFSMTIRDNLLLAKEDATENELLQALKKANAFDFVMDLDNKLDTFIGGGVSSQLSGGQKQRIAIARAILKGAKVLVLDEPTSSLDRTNEREIQATIDSLSRERTIIVVTHRLNTIKDADEIILMDEGRIGEMGTYEKLMQLQGMFYDLKNSQKKEPEENQNKRFLLEEKAHEIDEEEIINPNQDEEESLLKKDKLSAVSNPKELESKYSKKASGSNIMKQLWNLTKTQGKLFILGTIGSLGVAIATPVSQLWMSETIGYMTDPYDPDFRGLVNRTCILIMIAGILTFLSHILQFAYFTKASEKLTQDLRVNVFYKFLRIHMGWHDDPKNSPGNLTTNLETHVTSVGQMTGTSLGLIIQIVMTNVTAVILSIAIVWQLGVIAAIIVPIFLFVAINVNANRADRQKRCAQVLKKTEVLISETVNNMKTVISLNAQDKFLSVYGTITKEHLNIRLNTRIKNALLESGLFLVTFADFGVMYYIGMNLYTTLNVSAFKIIFAALFVPVLALRSTRLFNLLSDVGQATFAMQSLFDYLAMKSEIDIEDKNASYKGNIQGNIEFKNVTFSYPTRKVNVLKDISFKINSNKHTGIFGPNGCGKSTIMHLLLRLYDVDSGEILIDGSNIKEYDLHYLRRKIAIVSQEPVLFYGSIEYNLKYANEEVAEKEIKEASRKANALEFIENDENGFQRNVGAKGGQLSGGQKQRIAIARALLRKPAILLLDEATSALDLENENIVQEALMKISEGITTLAINHRSSANKQLDQILTFQDGTITSSKRVENN